ncbi:MAG TPA: phosphotransferase [Blastocatellia bacterium]|nr:phosphotransferase [Blastocatellia bacterium]
MEPLIDGATPIVGDAELCGALEAALGDHRGAAVRVRALRRNLSAYRSSFAIEEIAVELDDGTALDLVFKNLSRQGLDERARRAKPDFLYDPLREIETYRLILSPAALGAPAFYGAEVEPQQQRYWLFIEKVAGVELYQVGEFAVWQEAARWLAQLHSRFGESEELAAMARAAHLLRCNESYYRVWMDRARNFLGSRDRIGWLAARYQRVIERLLALPQTFIHGEFYASNLLVQTTAEGLRVRPVDWEMAAMGPGLIDLAALVAGNWTEAQRAALAAAYHAALTPDGQPPSPMDEFLIELDYCRLHVAVQWLGWFGRRRAFLPHARDWLGEAVVLAERLRL